MTVRKIKKSWWVDFRIDHIRYRKRSPENSRAAAVAFEATLRRAHVNGQSVQSKLQALTPVPFNEFAWNWYDTYVVPNCKLSGQFAKKYILRSWLVPFFGSTHVGHITGRRIEEYKAHAIGVGLSHKTVNNHLTVLKKCLGMAFEWHELPGSPPVVRWLKCPPPRTDYLTVEECRQLLAHASGVTYELLVTALRTGMRQGELKGLQWSSINWTMRLITVRHSKSDYTTDLSTTKSNRERHIPMHSDMVELLSRRRQEKGYVFLDETGHIFDHQRMRLRLNAVCKRAGVRHVGWHTLRHTFASHLAMEGVPLAAVQTLLGHSSIMMTMRYAHVAPSTLRSAIEMLTPANDNDGQPVGNRWVETRRKALQ